MADQAERVILEAVEGGVGLVRYRGDLVLGFEDYAFRLVCHLRCLEHHEGTSLKCREHGLAVARRDTPLRLATVVEGGDLRSRHSPARKSFVEKPNRRAVLICGQDLEAP